MKEAARCHFNLTEVSRVLFTSQSGISRHIKELEDELGVALFIRHGKRLLGLTKPGKEMLTIARRILDDAGRAKRLAGVFEQQNNGILTIATTHTQACYSLPGVIKDFRERFPDIRLMLNQGSPQEIASMVQEGAADIGIASEALATSDTLASFPWFEWHHAVLVPEDHPLISQPNLTLPLLAAWPLITYRPGMTGRNRIDNAFALAGLEPRIVLSAQDSDVVKTYVRLGMGVGIVAETALTEPPEPGLVVLSAKGLFAPNTVWLAVKQGQLQRDFLWQFIVMCNPNLSVDEIKQHALSSGKANEHFLDFEI